MEAMLDLKSEFQIFQAILSGSMVRAKRREVRRCSELRAIVRFEDRDSSQEQSLMLNAKRDSLNLEVVLDADARSGCLMVRNGLRC